MLRLVLLFQSCTTWQWATALILMKEIFSPNLIFTFTAQYHKSTKLNQNPRWSLRNRRKNTMLVRNFDCRTESELLWIKFRIQVNVEIVFDREIGLFSVMYSTTRIRGFDLSYNEIFHILKCWTLDGTLVVCNKL